MFIYAALAESESSLLIYYEKVIFVVLQYMFFHNRKWKWHEVRPVIYFFIEMFYNLKVEIFAPQFCQSISHIEIYPNNIQRDQFYVPHLFLLIINPNNVQFQYERQ